MERMTFKFFCQYFIFVIVFTVAIYFVYDTLIDNFIGLLRGYDYIFYTPLDFPTLFIFPGIFFIDFLCLAVLLPFRKKMRVVLGKCVVPLCFYCGVAIFLGFIVSLIVSIYPLSTHYYKCKSTSMISSGSYYARTKEMCQERKEWNAEQRKAAPARTNQKE